VVRAPGAYAQPEGSVANPTANPCAKRPTSVLPRQSDNAKVSEAQAKVDHAQTQLQLAIEAETRAQSELEASVAAEAQAQLDEAASVEKEAKAKVAEEEVTAAREAQEAAVAFLAAAEEAQQVGKGGRWERQARGAMTKVAAVRVSRAR
jgi:hypothetical protein